MTVKNTISTVKPVGNGNLRPFKKGYDPRRWLKGRGKKSPEQREGEKILLAVIWEELSREFDVATMQPLEPDETIDTLRLAVRNTIKKNFPVIMERIAGKVTERVDATVNGNLQIGVKYIDYRSGIVPANSAPGSGTDSDASSED